MGGEMTVVSAELRGEFSFVSDTIPTGIMRSFGAELTLRAE